MRRRCTVCQKVIDTTLEEQRREGKFYPFCSNRCKLIDLGRWIDGKYKIITEFKTGEDEGKNSGQSEVMGDNIGKEEDR